MNSIFTRVSIRKYQDRPVEKEKTLAILRAAMQAPSAANQQPWEFFVVTNKEKLLALSMVHPYSGMVKDAPLPSWQLIGRTAACRTMHRLTFPSPWKISGWKRTLRAWAVCGWELPLGKSG